MSVNISVIKVGVTVFEIMKRDAEALHKSVWRHSCFQNNFLRLFGWQTLSNDRNAVVSNKRRATASSCSVTTDAVIHVRLLIPIFSSESELRPRWRWLWTFSRGNEDFPSTSIWYSEMRYSISDFLNVFNQWRIRAKKSEFRKKKKRVEPGVKYRIRPIK